MTLGGRAGGPARARIELRHSIRLSFSLDAIFGGLRDGPPPHVLGCVPAAGLEGLDAGDCVAGAGAGLRSSGGARVFCEKFADGRGIGESLSVQVAHAVCAGGAVILARRREFGTHADLGVQNGTERERECSDSEQERVFRRHRACSVHVGFRSGRCGDYLLRRRLGQRLELINLNDLTIWEGRPNFQGPAHCLDIARERPVAFAKESPRPSAGIRARSQRARLGTFSCAVR
jgi:hypothetical protein